MIVGAPVIGVNARDLSTFEIDRETQLALVARIPADRIAIAESGIRTRAQGAAAELAGADAILVGSTLMQAPDPAAEAARAARAAARQGLRPHARGGRRRRGRGGRRPGRLHPRAGEPAGGEGRPAGPGRAARGRGLGRRGGHERRAGRPGARARGGRGSAAATRVLLRDGEQVARLLDLPWEEEDPGHWDRAAAEPGRVMLAGRLAADNVAEAIRRVRPWAVDAARGWSRPRGSRIRRRCARTSRRRGRDRDLRRLRRPLRPRDADPGARRAHGRVGGGARGRELPRRAGRARPELRRPPDAAHARRAVRARQAALPQARGPAPHRRAQAQQRARPGRARAAARQAADRRRDRRRPARRRDGDRLRALRARLRRLHGRRGHAPPEAERRADGPARRRGAPGRVRDEDA